VGVKVPQGGGEQSFCVSAEDVQHIDGVVGVLVVVVLQNSTGASSLTSAVKCVSTATRRQVLTVVIFGKKIKPPKCLRIPDFRYLLRRSLSLTRSYSFVLYAQPQLILLDPIAIIMAMASMSMRE